MRGKLSSEARDEGLYRRVAHLRRLALHLRLRPFANRDFIADRHELHGTHCHRDDRSREQGPAEAGHHRCDPVHLCSVL